MEACWTLFLLTTLGATAVRGTGNPTITDKRQDNGTVVLTCTFERQTLPKKDTKIDILWFVRRGAMKTQGNPEFLEVSNEKATQSERSVTNTLLITQSQLTSNNVGEVYFCIVQDMSEFGHPPRRSGIYPQMWVSDATPTDTTTTPTAGSTTSSTTTDKATTPTAGSTTSSTTTDKATTPTTGSTTSSTTTHKATTPTTGSTTSSTTTDKATTPTTGSTSPGKDTPITTITSDPIVQAMITVIFILVVAVIVLTVFIIRMKRNFKGKTPKGGRQHDEFYEYALPVDASESDDLYRSLGKAQRIQAQMNAAFEPEGSNYNDVFGKVGRPAGSDPQGRLKDGYKGDGTTDTPAYQVVDPDAPVYQQVLDPDAEANEYEEALAANATGATGEGQPHQGGSNLAGVVTKKRGAGTNDYSYVDAKPPHQKAKGSEMAAGCSPGNADDGYSHISRTPMPDEQDDVYSHVNRPRVTGSSNTEDAADGDYSQPYGKAKMAAKGWQGNDGDDYNRLELPSLSNPRPLAAMQKEGKTAATSGTSHPAPGRVATDDENDYEQACNVVQ